eukprot:scaffold576_cov260-Pinguiococcus_pyrenoidosus.AAC.79
MPYPPRSRSGLSRVEFVRADKTAQSQSRNRNPLSTRGSLPQMLVSPLRGQPKPPWRTQE